MFFFACFFRLFSSFASPWNTFCLHSARSFRRRRCRCRRLFYVFYFFTFEFRVYFNNRLLGNWERQCADWSCFADLFFSETKKFLFLFCILSAYVRFKEIASIEIRFDIVFCCVFQFTYSWWYWCSTLFLRSHFICSYVLWCDSLPLRHLFCVLSSYGWCSCLIFQLICVFEIETQYNERQRSSSSN